MGHNIEQGAGGGDCRLLKFKGFVASVPRLLKLIVPKCSTTCNCVHVRQSIPPFSWGMVVATRWGGGVIAENEDSVKKIFHIQIVLHHVLLTI
jgi:hypothetical protein